MNPDRLPELERLVYQLNDELVNILAPIGYPAEKISNLPFQFKIEIDGLNFQFVLSGMGSFTIRFQGHERYNRHPAPIFYISLAEDSSGELYWQDIEGNSIEIDEFLLDKIKIKIQDLRINLEGLK
jgi:hypothetical protein